MTRTIRAVGLVRYDETRLADVNLKIEGWIGDLYVDSTGQLVQEGDPLFTLYSPELLATVQEYLFALETRDQLRESQVVDARDHADRLVESARRRLELWDLPPDELQLIDEARRAQTTVTFRSPVSGYVIEKPIVQGLHVMPGQTLYRVADLSVVWIEADVYEQEIGLVRVGQTATVTLDAYPGERFAARVVYVYPFVEERTRSVRVRFALANDRGRLKPGMYANVELQAPVGMSTTIPGNALLDSGSRRLVFVSEGDGFFQPRDVVVGLRLGDRVQILEGLEVGELVATSATFFLDSESQLRASVQAFEPGPAPGAGAGSAERLAITFRSDPDPPRPGASTFEVTVRDADGRPVADADVSVVFFMAAMPTMNMPAMRTEAVMPAVGGGVYRGAGQVAMAGRWDVTVTVSRNGERLGSSQSSVVVR
jgi:Cu(I)/Ag(I) efflux system membrane fusion protein/cobalt-zinc-cadmium efflux system membrane fusion protein